MISIQIPKEISSYESKLIGPFTTRQTICVFCMALVDIILYNLIGGFVSMDLAIFGCILGAAPFALIGWYKPYGMHFEKYVKSIFVSQFLAPTKRIYKTENTFDPYRTAILNYEKDKRSGKLHKKKQAAARKSAKKPVQKKATVKKKK